VATAAAPRMLRARLTEAEHHALTVIAAQTKTPVADLVAAALRVAYPLTPKETNEHGS
jgi:hypothetical protein